jgi:anion-transporting  ArsA/GET3 family ATPase
VDFLSAPRHLTRLLDNPAFRMLIMPSRVSLRSASFIAQASLKIATKIVGAEMVLDTVAFLHAFEGMEAGIRTRSKRVLELFAEPSTAFILVVAPRQDAIEEGRFFAAHLGQYDIPIQGLIVNRLYPRFDARPDPTPPIVADGTSDRFRSGVRAQAFTVLTDNWVELRAVAHHEENCVAPLAAQLAPAPVVRVPFLGRDVHDLAGVQSVADCLVASLTEDVGSLDLADAVHIQTEDRSGDHKAAGFGS